ncbi:hypothetical protein BDV3_005503 [Batrachochytrium dendrobatidis]
MSSRTALLLEREHHRLQKDNTLHGISYRFVNNSLFQWHVTLQGLKDTLWEGGIFKVDIYFGEGYNDEPPSIYFLTVPFHPNIDMNTGKPCISFLDFENEWNSSISMQAILLQLQCMLSEPCLESPVNPAAADIFQRSPRLYDQLVQDSVVASRRLDAGLPIFDEEIKTPSSPKNSLDLDTLPSVSKDKYSMVNVSYETYHSDWKKIGTSLATPQPWVSNRSQITKFQYQDLIKRQDRLWYGKFKSKKHDIVDSGITDRKLQLKLDRIESMKRIYNLSNLIDTNHHTRCDMVSTRVTNSQKSTLAEEPFQDVPHLSSNGISMRGNALDSITLPSTLEQAEDLIHVESNSTKSSVRSNSAHTSKQSTLEITQPIVQPIPVKDRSWEMEADDLVEWSKELPI